jgi:methylglutaconyl-CoA hydratase
VSQSKVIVSVDERGLATVTLNRPDVHNAFDDALIETLADVLGRLDRDRAARVVVLCANGKSFSAGADLRWMQRTADYSETENLEDAQRLAGLMSTLRRMCKPTVARVQGSAFGGGVGLVACCDIVLASENARFALTEVKLGLIPAVISPYLSRAMGERHARRYMLTGERFSAEEACRLGLVHEVVPESMLDERVRTVISMLLENGPEAMAAIKSLLDRVAGGPLDEAMIGDTARRIAEVRASEEGKEGVTAFLEKRRPRWTKRR